MAEQPTVRAMDLDHVVPAVLRHLGGAGIGFDELEHNVFGHFRGHDAIGVFECAGRVELAIRCDGERVPATVMRQRDGRDSAVLGAIYGGICTPSEAAAVSVFYAAFVGLFVYKKINFKDCVQIFVKTCCTAGVCGFMVFCVSMVSRIFMVENLNGAVEALAQRYGRQPLRDPSVREHPAHPLWYVPG